MTKDDLDVTATIDSSCIGCNACVEVAPELFARLDRKAVVRRAASRSLLGDLREAQAVCPVGALHVVEPRGIA
jgi:ferredoxin